MSTEDEWITTAEAAELSGYHPDHVRRLIRRGALVARKFGPLWQINRTALLDHLCQGRETGDGRRGPKTRG